MTYIYHCTFLRAVITFPIITYFKDINKYYHINIERAIDNNDNI